jgi:hypothetical protein
MSGLTHHVSQSTILLDKTEQKYDEISTNLEHFPHIALEIISDIGCNYTNVAECPRFLVCEAFWTDEYFSAFWWHQISWNSWRVLAKWHSIDLRRLWISGLFLFLMSYVLWGPPPQVLLPIWNWLDRPNTGLLCPPVSMFCIMLQKQCLFEVQCTLIDVIKVRIF